MVIVPEKQEKAQNVGFDFVITFDKDGEISDYQKSFNLNYSKNISIYLPLNFNNREKCRPRLLVSINNTFPKQVEIVEGHKCENDLNKFDFDVTQLYYLAMHRKFGLCQFILYSDDYEEIKFKSRNFRV